MPDPVITQARGRALRSLADDVESVADSDPRDGDVAGLVPGCAARASMVLSAAHVISQATPVDAVAESPVNPMNWF